jgi:hypothetical protein
MWHFVDLGFANPIFFVICGLAEVYILFLLAHIAYAVYIFSMCSFEGREQMCTFLYLYLLCLIHNRKYFAFTSNPFQSETKCLEEKSDIIC